MEESEQEMGQSQQNPKMKYTSMLDNFSDRIIESQAYNVNEGTLLKSRKSSHPASISIPNEQIMSNPVSGPVSPSQIISINIDEFDEKTPQKMQIKKPAPVDPHSLLLDHSFDMNSIQRTEKKQRLPDARFDDPTEGSINKELPEEAVPMSVVYSSNPGQHNRNESNNPMYQKLQTKKAPSLVRQSAQPKARGFKNSVEIAFDRESPKSLGIVSQSSAKTLKKKVAKMRRINSPSSQASAEKILAEHQEEKKQVEEDEVNRQRQDLMASKWANPRK